MTRAGSVTSGHPGGHDPRVVEQLQQQIAGDDALRLDVADGTESLATWFLGPKAETATCCASLSTSPSRGRSPTGVRTSRRIPRG